MFSRKFTAFFFLSLLFLSPLACKMETPRPPSKEPLGEIAQAVIGGKPDLRYPAIGAMVVDQRHSFCTGTLITPQLVITAAHCIDAAESYRRQGSQVDFRIDMPSGVTFRRNYFLVQSMQNHPQWRGGRGLNNDIGVLILSSNVTITPPLPVNTTPLDSSWVGRDFTFLGYGLIQTRPRIISADQKYGADIPVIRVYSNRFDNFKEDVSICSGDSGGPALYSINGVMSVVGVNSYVQGSTVGNGQPACDGTSTSFRVDAYMSWLQPLINLHGGTCSSDADCSACFTCVNSKCDQQYPPSTGTLCKPCKADPDCGQGGLCVRTPEGYRCGQACESPSCCPQGFICASIGTQRQCIRSDNTCPPAACSTDTDCGLGETCQTNLCKPAPVPNETGACKPCNNGACGNNQLCAKLGIGGERCLQRCAFDNFCPQGQTCREVGNTFYCFPSNDLCACSANTDCEQGEVCRNAICQKPDGGTFGDLCNDLKPCAANHQCNPLPSGGSMCVQPCDARRILPACTGGASCQYSSDYSVACDTNANACICIPAGSREAGESCSPGQLCKEGLDCLPLGKSSICFERCQPNQPNSCLSGGQCNIAANAGIFYCGCSASIACPTGKRCNIVRDDGIGFCSASTSRACIGTCKGEENCSTCPLDCPCASGTQCVESTCKIIEEPSCGDNQCNGNEDCSTCPQDCPCDPNQSCQNGVCKAPMPTPCGDGTCNSNGGENCSTCPQDCACPPDGICQDGVCKTPTPEVTNDAGEKTPEETTEPNNPPPSQGCAGCNATNASSPHPSNLLFLLFLLLALPRRSRRQAP